MATNGYLEKKEKHGQALLDVGVETGKQQIIDFLCMALREPAVVGTDIFGEERLYKVLAYIEYLDHKFADAYTLKVEADYLQEKLDAKLREAFKDKLVPFKVRYPHIKQLGYQKARKGWK